MPYKWTNDDKFVGYIVLCTIVLCIGYSLAAYFHYNAGDALVTGIGLVMIFFAFTYALNIFSLFDQKGSFVSEKDCLGLYPDEIPE